MKRKTKKKTGSGLVKFRSFIKKRTKREAIRVNRLEKELEKAKKAKMKKQTEAYKLWAKKGKKC